MHTAGGAWHRSRSIDLMYKPENNFKAREVILSSILCDEPGMHSGSIPHGSRLYVLQGDGYSIIDGQRYPEAGTLLQIQGPQTVHSISIRERSNHNTAAPLWTSICILSYRLHNVHSHTNTMNTAHTAASLKNRRKYAIIDNTKILLQMRIVTPSRGFLFCPFPYCEYLCPVLGRRSKTGGQGNPVFWHNVPDIKVMPMHFKKNILYQG